MPSSQHTPHEQEQLDEILAILKPNHVHHPMDIAEAVVDLIKLAQETTNIHDFNLIRSTIQEIRKTIKVFFPYRDSRKVCMVRRARTPTTPTTRWPSFFRKRSRKRGLWSSPAPAGA
jgi:hypothetical protein